MQGMAAQENGVSTQPVGPFWPHYDSDPWYMQLVGAWVNFLCIMLCGFSAMAAVAIVIAPAFLLIYCIWGVVSLVFTDRWVH